MAGQTTTEVRVGAPKVGGYAFSAPLATTRPTAAGVALDAAYIDLGYISEDGVEVTTERGTTKVYDWNRDVIATIQEANECTLSFTMVQISPASSKELFGAGNVTVSGTAPNEKVTKISYKGEELPHKQYVFPMKDGNGATVLDIGDGQITSIGNFSFNKSGVVSFPVTLELYKDATGSFIEWHFA